MVPSYSRNLSRAENYLLNLLIENEQSAVTQYTFFRSIQVMYGESKKLYLKHEIATTADHFRFIRNLYSAGLIRYDTDYGNRLIRVLDITEKSNEEVVCLADPLCYVSHLSAMHRWGLTDRSSKALTCTRPDRKTSTIKLMKMMSNHPAGLPPKRVRLKYIKHPDTVRNREIYMSESKSAGTTIKIPGTGVRLSTIGQTFLDMLQYPKLCGGMPHVLEIYEEHAEFWLEEIVDSVDSVTSGIVKSRAGYILEERLGLKHKKIESWKTLAQRGGSRKLDPSKDFAHEFSETWMISLNV